MRFDLSNFLLMRETVEFFCVDPRKGSWLKLTVGFTLHVGLPHPNFGYLFFAQPVILMLALGPHYKITNSPAIQPSSLPQLPRLFVYIVFFLLHRVILIADSHELTFSRF